MTTVLVVGFGHDIGAAPATPEDDILEEYLADSDKAPKTHRPPPTVLVVDDDDDIRGALKDILEDEHYGVETAVDGLDALNRLFDGPRPDLILLDIMLPRLNGIAFLRAFEMTHFADVPVVLISAGNQRDVSSRHDRRFAFLGKPIDVGALLALVADKIAEGKRRNG